MIAMVDILLCEGGLDLARDCRREMPRSVIRPQGRDGRSHLQARMATLDATLGFQLSGRPAA
jgi:hypothetical protein